MGRPLRQHVDEDILDRAAALFARRGFAKTSLQDVADAVGLSKAGLLHHFPSKDALYAAVLALVDDFGARVVDQVGNLPPGAARDRQALEVLVDVALAHPGIVALMLAPVAQPGTDADGWPVARSEAPLRAFGVDLQTTDAERLVRVIGALGALAVLTLAAHSEDRISAWRRHIVDTCSDALGHRRPGGTVPAPAQGEA